MHALATSFILGYHGCDASVAERLLSGKPFRQSTNDYDWLGHGVYFWEVNPRRGLEFARELAKSERGKKIKVPAVVGAVIDLGLCLDLTTSAGITQVRTAHRELDKIAKAAGVDLPKNSEDQLRHNLDCAVIQALHGIRDASGEPSVDTVKGVFLEGKRVYRTAGFYEKTHVQVCVRNLNCIKGVFRVPRKMSR